VAEVNDIRTWTETCMKKFKSLTDPIVKIDVLIMCQEMEQV